VLALEGLAEPTERSLSRRDDRPSTIATDKAGTRYELRIVPSVERELRWRAV